MKYAVLLLLGGLPLPGKDSCFTCHSQLEGRFQAPAAVFQKSVHFQHGFSCSACHGGDSNSDDPEVAMSKAHGFIGVPPRTAIPKLCATCHSNPNVMRKYNPSERVDQYAEYLTSTHGQRLAKGDTAVATCVDCHSVHNISAVHDPTSPVYPLNLPKTCAHCHADAAHMAPYHIPTDQYANYVKSVHWQEISQRGDLSAPTCATCHGNHGAKPPSVNSVGSVCGTCHVFEDQLYQKSPHQPVFSAMDTGACVVCHSNHAILKTSDQMLGGKDAVCKQCHDADSAGGQAAAKMASLMSDLANRLAAADAVLAQAQNSGVEVSDATLRQRDAHQSLVKARADVHAFAIQAVSTQVQEGLAIANEDYRAGQSALKERDVRRAGLAVSLAAILVTIAGLWLMIGWFKQHRT
ncbi:MAG TPA: cytochrome c3 family protein [Bryobacteraceae bacterium]|nr:cytochrome c3 family protein [Bryobacteraceae bacterium]